MHLGKKQGYQVMGLKTVNQKMEYLKNGVRYCLLLIFLVLAFATGAHAAQDNYYYPNYDASANGCVDLMNYVKRVTVTVNGVDYTLDQLDQMRQQGTPLTMQVGDTISFNVLFGLQGRAYDPNDATLVDESKSTWVTYSHDTTMLDGSTVAGGTQGILDDSSLMKENTTKGNSYLRMDIGWLLDACPGSYNIEYTDGNVSFYQGGENNRYLYVYFPHGVGNDTYAENGYFTITTTLSRTMDSIAIPVTNWFYGSRTSWTVYVSVKEHVENSYSGNISTYGRITVKKKWVTDDANHGPAKIVLTYTQDGQQRSATRTITGDGTAYFDIRQGMTNCNISEDMTGLDGYVSTMTTSEDGKTFTFTNSKRQKLIVSKKSATGSDELPGAKLVVYSVGSDGSQSEIDSWKTESTPHEMQLSPGNYLLRETYAPAGYAMTSDITFTINADYTVTVTSKTGKLDGQTLTVIDQPLEVKLSKVDPNGNSLPGAAMTLTDKNTGKLVHSWTSGTEPEKLVMTGNTGEVLVAGHTYIMHEESAPSGYAQAADVEFYFNGDGTIPNCGYHLVKMVDQPSVTPTPDVPTTDKPDRTPNPDGTPTPTPDGPNTPGGNPTPTPSDNGGKTPKTGPTPPPNVPSFSNGQYGLPTGDSPVMWVFLVLAIVCLGGGIAMIVLRKKNENGNDDSDSSRG